MKKLIYLLLIVGSFLITVAFSCGPTPPPPPPSNGFTVLTTEQQVVNGIAMGPRTVSREFASEFLIENPPGNPTIGTLGHCSGTTNSAGLFPCPDRMVPAIWSLTEFTGFCAGQTILYNVFAGGFLNANCSIEINTFGISPDSVDANAPPATIEITGYGMSSSYGMPVIQIVDSYGNAVTSTTATSCTGSWLQAPTPYLGYVYSGSYVAMVYNVGYGGDLQLVGGAWLYIYGNSPPPPDPDPCFGVYPCDIYPY
ncbi:MAG: hypothetical protein AABN33_07755 [Acidobacteriota bacterium]